MEENLMPEAFIKKIDPNEAEHFSALVLAYIGDAVFEVFVRKMLIAEANMQVNKLHRAATALVKAEAQSRMIGILMPELSEKEIKVYRRGRNAKSNTSAKNASITDYRRATGFEALMGYLYLSGQKERMLELMEKAVISERNRKDEQ